MPLALWGVVGLLVLILANGMAWLGLVPVLPTFSSYSLFDGIYYSDNRSNSRANTCNKPRLLEGMHLLDKRSTQALPVALMIHDNSSDRTAFVPATHHSNFCPINFRCWTLGWVDRSASGVHRLARPFCRRCAPGLNWPGRASGAVSLRIAGARGSKWAIFGKQNWRCGMNRKLGYGAQLRANLDPTKGVGRLRQQDGGHGSRNPLRSV
ncbi:hypothetical protein VNO78_29237 [Psophocarpus tetragonolobus]|uniref:Uncharacterized protein n=1 Tax=Psophocarpus tetragonolobus TaxID=3891 RepID=A0AAN9RUS6_PSOTE